MYDETIKPVQHISVNQKKPFKPGSWLTTINFINHLVLFNNVLMAVFAEPGNGKSTFSDLLRTGIDPQIESLVIKATKGFSSKEFLLLAQAFSHDNPGESLTAYVEKINATKIPTLVIIDDAHNLAEDFLKELLEEISNQKNSGFFHVCLLADYSLVACLNELEANYFKDKIHSIELGALTESETKTYILKNLSASKRIEQTMTDKRLEKFYLLTGGNIARINRQMAHFFNSNAVTAAAPAKKRSSISRFNLVASTTFVILGALFFLQNSTIFDDLKKPATISTGRLAVENVRLPSQIPAFTVAAKKDHFQPRPLKRVFDLREDEEGDLEKLVVMDKVVATPKTLQKHSVKETHLPSNLVAISTLFENRDQLASQDTALQEDESAYERLSLPSVAKKLPKRTEIVAKAVETTVKTYAKGNFTIQLMASRSQSDLQRFINSNLTNQSAKISTVNRDGVEWYVLTLGQYDKKETAKEAVKELPSNLAKLQPWIRSTDGLMEVG